MTVCSWRLADGFDAALNGVLSNAGQPAISHAWQDMQQATCATQTFEASGLCKDGFETCSGPPNAAPSLLEAHPARHSGHNLALHD